MTKRSQWCEFDKEERKYIKKRDGEKCIVCGAKGALQIMHIFLNRSHGGKGTRENGVLGCIRCHKILDNPIGTQENLQSKIIMEKCKNYLIEKENIKDVSDIIERLKYTKTYIPIETNIDKIRQVKTKERCKNCRNLIKNKFSKTSIPSYYCKYRHIVISKNTESCKSFKSNT